MDEQRRIEYLQVLGVDVWLPRRPNAAAAPLETPLPASHLIAPAVESAAAQGSGVAARGMLEQNPVTERSVAPPPVANDSGARPEISAIGPAAANPSPIAPAAPVAARAAKPPSDPQLSTEDSAGVWSALKAEVLGCTKCPLHQSRTQGVFGVGDPLADWLVIGEAPGAEEDKRGEPFVGRGGQLLDAMLRGISLKRGENVYIANILKSRPPNNRDPKPEEVSACIPYLHKQIALIRPRLILAVGRIAAQNLLATDTPLGRLRGRVHRFGELNTPLIVTYHPAYLLRSPAEKRKAWEDLKFARGLYRQLIAQAS